jgi:FMN phosphatase YigB (HAD superfamily)
VAVSFDLFGTLVAADTPEAPSAAVAAELRDRGVEVPGDFRAAYREQHIDSPAGAEVPLPAHVSAALSSRGVSAPENAARRAVVAAFDPAVERRAGVETALEAAREHGPVGVCSNCSVPELARRALVRADLRGEFDAVVTSVGCGWRKPDERAFETIARELDAKVADLVHVGDDPATDGGVTDAGGRFVHVESTPLSALASALEGRA